MYLEALVRIWTFAVVRDGFCSGAQTEFLYGALHEADAPAKESERSY
jgi:hypothetical protein